MIATKSFEVMTSTSSLGTFGRNHEWKHKLKSIVSFEREIYFMCRSDEVEVITSKDLVAIMTWLYRGVSFIDGGNRTTQR
jgi:hypothetical protein